MAPKKGKSKSRSTSKGKGKKKKEPLTDEQKRKIAEQKAFAEHEKLVRRQNLTKAFLKVKKDKEYELIKLNNNKLLDLWRPHLRKQKIKELMDDYRMMQLSFERAYDKKTGLIREMEKTMEDNEQEYDQAVDMHMYNIDKLMEFYHRRIKEVQLNYTAQRQKLIDSLNDERQYIQDEQKRSLNELRNAMANMVANYEGSRLQAQIELRMKEEDLRNGSTQELYTFRQIIEKNINQCWKDIYDKIKSYSESTAGKRKELVKLMEKDEKMSAIISAQFQRLNILGGGIKELNNRSELFARAFAKYIDDLVQKKAECRDEYERLMTASRKLTFISKSSFANLALASHEVLAKMKEFISKRERIMKSCERVRKLEFLEDKVDPFLLRWKFDLYSNEEMEGTDILMSGRKPAAHEDQSSDDAMTKFAYRVGGVFHHFRCDCETCTCEQENQGKIGLNAPTKTLMGNYSMLEKFWSRYNKAAIEREALLVRRNAYLQDNKNLRMSLRNYMGGLNPPALDVIQFSNELVVNQTPSFPSPNPNHPYNATPLLNPNRTPQSRTTGRKSLEIKDLFNGSRRRSKSCCPSLVRRSTGVVIEGVNVIRSLEKFTSNRPSLGFPTTFH